MLALLVALLASVGLIAPASSAEWIVLCTGYDSCNAAGYPDSGYKAVSSTSYWRQTPGHNCTNYVAYRLVKNGMPNERPASLTGNAYNWGPAFPDLTDDKPVKGAVAWWDTSYSATGHVAYVEKVVSPDEILVSEDNWGGDFRWRRVTRMGGRWPQGFIHLRDQATPVSDPKAYRPLATPGRLMDTRSGLGVAAGKLAGGVDVALQVTGRGGVPSSGVGAVLLNVTSFGQSTPGWVTAYASGSAAPGVRSASYFGSYYTNNEVVTRVGADGKVKLRPSSTVGLVVDVVGWLPSTSWVTTTTPTRIVDTRSGLGAPTAKVPAGGRIDVTVAGRGGIPATGAVAAVLSVTAPKPAASGWVAAWATGTTRPGVADLQVSGGSSTTGLVTSLIGSTGRVSLYSTTATDLVVDVVGWVPVGSDVTVLRPTRVLDTRSSGIVAGGTSVRAPVRGVAGVPTAGVVGALVSITTVGSTGSGALTAYPAGTTRPGAGTTHFMKGQVVTTLAVLPLGDDGGVRVYTSTTSHVIVDVHGYVRG
ncbi:MAG TPA: CHAP domain-containing protein [Humibacillus sp.]|nr:CHAP domain-containing protein [Humibacillus sp.]